MLHLNSVKHEKLKKWFANLNISYQLWIYYFFFRMEFSHRIEQKLKYHNESIIDEKIRQKWMKILGNNYNIYYWYI
jgi:hypothetical protein